MNNIIKISFILLAIMLSSCGGGGSDCGSKGILFGAATCAINNDSSSNPLKKYEGTYYICETNLKSTVIITTSGQKGLNLLRTEDVYSGANCSGSIVGTYKMNSPISITYTGTTTANLPAVTVFPYSDSIDTVRINTDSMTFTLTGSAVTGSCVHYSYLDNGTTTTGNQCYSLTTSASTANGAIYLSSDNKYFITLLLNNGVYTADSIASRDPNFNYASLVSR